MRRRCEACKYFKYVESNIYGRCQYKTGDSALEGIPRVPWATACDFFQAKSILDKNDLDEECKIELGITQKRTDSNVIAHRLVVSKTDCTTT